MPGSYPAAYLRFNSRSKVTEPAVWAVEAISSSRKSAIDPLYLWSSRCS